MPGVQSLSAFWGEYSRSSAPPLSPALLLAGREKEVETASQWLQTGLGVLRVLADSSDEALAFIAAIGLDRSIDDTLANNIVVVNDAEQARQLLNATNQITFGWQLEDPSLLGTITDKGHRAIVPMSRNATGAQHAEPSLVRRSGYTKFVEAVKKSLRDALPPKNPASPLSNASAVAEEDQQLRKAAEKRAKESGRSITVYRRLYPAFGVAMRPDWASREGGLVPILLAGSWAEGNEADQAALSSLAASEYASVNHVVARWKNQPDSPLRQVADAWELAAPLDAWSLLSKSINQADLDRYKKVALAVLGESDPTLTLESNERYLASFQGKKFKHSSALRRGLVETLIMLSVVADEALLGSEHAKEVVWRLLGRDAPPAAWASLYELLPQLAEAAPEIFLSALEGSLQQKPSPIVTLFEAEDKPLGGQFRYPNLLWALEALSWFPEYLGKTASILAQLAKLFPKKERSLVNRPEKSLREIFCSWHPNTTANLDQRLEVIDGLIKFEDPTVIWDLLMKLLPKMHDVGATNAEPKWRALPEQIPPTYGEIWRANEQIIARTMKEAKSRADRLVDLIEQTRTWSPEQRASLLVQLREFAASCKKSNVVSDLWNAARNFVAHNRTYGFIEEVEMLDWDEFLSTIEPKDPVERHLPLFESEVAHLTRPKALFTKKQAEDSSGIKATEARMEESSQEREVAATQIFEQCGLKGILALASRAKSPYLVGLAAAQISKQDDLDFEIVEKTLETSDANVRVAGMAFAATKNESKGAAWTQSILDSSRFRTWSAPMQAAFCRTLPENRTTWNFVESLGEEVQDLFWKTAAVFLGRIATNEDAEHAMMKLLQAGRALDALDQAGFVPERLSPQLLVDVLDKVFEHLSESKPNSSHLVDYNVERILQRLQTSGEASDTVLGRLEWQFLPLLRFSHRPVTLNKALQRDPAFFADLVKCAFRAENESKHQEASSGEMDSVDDVSQNKARYALDLLSKWKDMPGRREDSTLDEQQLDQWVHEARTLNAANRRQRVGDIQIGRMLAFSFPGKDGIWPEEAVRDVIERSKSKDLESGLHMGKFNSRGVYSKLPADGGRPEREIAKRLKSDAKKLATRWQRTSSILNSIAEVYERFGRYDDATAEAMDLLE